jgi:DNA-binding response OmpR family regulator
VVTAGDGEEAWQTVSTQPLDLVLVDLEMPKLDGFDLVRRMRAEPRFNNLPIIVVTGREDVSAIDRAFNCGATSFVTKPINWRLLSYQVRFTLRAGRAERRLDLARPARAWRTLAPPRPCGASIRRARNCWRWPCGASPRSRPPRRRFATMLTRWRRARAASKAA